MVKDSPEISRAFTLVEPRELRLKKNSGGRLEIDLPRLHEYEVVVLE